MAAPAHQDLGYLNRTYRPALMAFFLRRLRNHAEAEDMTQEVFMRLARADRGEVGQPDAYVFRVAANLLRDRARKEKVRFAYRAELAAEADLGVEPLDPSRIVRGQQALSALTLALRELPEPTRDIFVLYKLEYVAKGVIAETFGPHQSDRRRGGARAHRAAGASRAAWRAVAASPALRPLGQSPSPVAGAVDLQGHGAHVVGGVLADPAGR